MDGGTESIRAGVFDLAGTPLAFASHAYPTAFPHPGWAEQNPADWWAGLGAAVREAVASAGIQTTDVAAICVVSWRGTHEEAGWLRDGTASTPLLAPR